MTELDRYESEFVEALLAAGWRETVSGLPRCYEGIVTPEWQDTASGNWQSTTHAVEVVLPAGFPYQAPIVVVKDQPPLRPSWHLNPGLSQTLCLWVDEDGWKPFFTAHTLLRRIDEWFSCYHTDRWPPDAEMPDLHLYLSPLGGVVIIGNEWQPPAGQLHDRFTLWHSDKVTVARRLLASSKVNQDRQPSEERLAVPLLLNGRSVRRTTGAYFRIPEPIVPPDDLTSLLQHIDRATNMGVGWARKQLIAINGEKSDDVGLALALGYHDRHEQERWLFLWAAFPQRQAKRYHWSRQSEMSRIDLKSFRTAPASRHDLLRRSAFLSDSLRFKRVCIFGVGALGGSIALLLAKCGVGSLRLIDKDIILPANASRHVCSLLATGYSKVAAVALEITGHAPDCVVEQNSAAWDEKTLRDYVKDCDLVLDATANANFSLCLNHICLSAAVRLLTVTAHRRGRVGRLVVHQTTQDPCLVCYLEPELHWMPDTYPIIPAGESESFIEDGCGSVTEEGVALDMESIANFTARVVVQVVLGEETEGNLAVLVNSPVPGAEGVLARPGTYWLKNVALENCTECSTF